MPDEHKQIVFIAEKKPEYAGIDDFVGSERFGFDGWEKIFVCETAKGHEIEYLAGIRTFGWKEEGVRELADAFIERGWMVNDSFRAWKKFSVLYQEDFAEALDWLDNARRFIAAYTSTYDALCAGKDLQERPLPSDLIKKVDADVIMAENKEAENKGSIKMEATNIDLEGFKKEIQTRFSGKTSKENTVQGAT